MRIRPMTTGDYDQVYALWLSTPGMGLNTTDDSREGARLAGYAGAEEERRTRHGAP